MLLIYLPYLCVDRHTYERRADVEIRGQLAEVSSFLPQSETWGSGVATRALPGTRPSGSKCGLLHLASGSSDDL